MHLYNLKNVQFHRTDLVWESMYKHNVSYDFMTNLVYHQEIIWGWSLHKNFRSWSLFSKDVKNMNLRSMYLDTYYFLWIMCNMKILHFLSIMVLWFYDKICMTKVRICIQFLYESLRKLSCLSNTTRTYNVHNLGYNSFNGQMKRGSVSLLVHFI